MAAPRCIVPLLLSVRVMCNNELLKCMLITNSTSIICLVNHAIAVAAGNGGKRNCAFSVPVVLSRSLAVVPSTPYRQQPAASYRTKSRRRYVARNHDLNAGECNLSI